MSQEKVNKYKEEKANRKAILKKEKRNRILGQIVLALCGAALAIWIGFSIAHNIEKNTVAAQTEINLDAVQDYLGTLSE